MLDRQHRLTRSQDFTVAMRGGARAGTTTVVVHLGPAGGEQVRTVAPPVKVGFVVGRAVGNAVIRNQVKRRLRHLVRDRLVSVPGGSLLVVRALPAAGTASSETLAEDLDAALARAVRRLADRGGA
jgi:ribonuclease P protein component